LYKIIQHGKVKILIFSYTVKSTVMQTGYTLPWWVPFIKKINRNQKQPHQTACLWLRFSSNSCTGFTTSVQPYSITINFISSEETLRNCQTTQPSFNVCMTV